MEMKYTKIMTANNNVEYDNDFIKSYFENL